MGQVLCGLLVRPLNFKMFIQRIEMKWNDGRMGYQKPNGWTDGSNGGPHTETRGHSHIWCLMVYTLK